jgi:hypothetical protein
LRSTDLHGLSGRICSAIASFIIEDSTAMARLASVGFAACFWWQLATMAVVMSATNRPLKAGIRMRRIRPS